MYHCVVKRTYIYVLWSGHVSLCCEADMCLCAAHAEPWRQLELLEERQLSELYTQEWRS